MTREVLQNTARPFKVYMVDDTDLKTPETALVQGDFTVTLSKSGLAQSAVSPTITPRGNGWYEVTPLAAHRDTLGESAWTFQATGAVDYPRLEDVIAVDNQVASREADTTKIGGQTVTATGTVDADKIANLDAAISTRNAIAPNNAGILANGTAIGLLNDPSAEDVATAVEAAILDEGDATALLAAIAAKVETFILNDGDASATLAAIAAAVWSNDGRTLTQFAFGVNVLQMAGMAVSATDVVDFDRLVEIVNSIEGLNNLSSEAAQSAAAAALTAYDPATRAEATADKTEIIARGNVAWITGGGGGNVTVDSFTDAAISQLLVSFDKQIVVRRRSPLLNRATNDLYLLESNDYLFEQGKHEEFETDLSGVPADYNVVVVARGVDGNSQITFNGIGTLILQDSTISVRIGWAKASLAVPGKYSWSVEVTTVAGSYVDTPIQGGLTVCRNDHPDA